AEMPDFYQPAEFDMAGFAVGVVERDRIIDGRDVEVGDVVIGVASDGLHSNGYGLARRVLADGGDLQERPAELEGRSVGEELLRPTRIYVKPVLNVVSHYREKRVVKAMAHITGGGLPGNLPRVVPDGLTVRVKRDSWPIPAIFKLIASRGPVDPIEMLRVFNMGVGFCLVVSQGLAQAVMNRLRRSGELCWQIGKVVEGGPELEWA
ncbi:MAG: phosphoribosylformylglycinamidine cyclo-ligase, partial [Planctomycetota bacterium]